MMIVLVLDKQMSSFEVIDRHSVKVKQSHIQGRRMLCLCTTNCLFLVQMISFD